MNPAHTKNRILFVDDEPLMLNALRRAMHPQRLVWEGEYLVDPCEAWQRLQGAAFDAVVTDIHMPGLTGLELLERMQAAPQTAGIPVVIVSGAADQQLKRRALELGAADLLNKPVAPEDLIARLRSALKLRSYQEQLRAANQRWEQAVRERTEELSQSRLDIIWRLGTAAEHRDQETANHVIRVGCASRAIAEAMGMDREVVETLFLAAPLHDIGKVGIPDAILLKRGPLSPSEWAVMQQHCRIGAQILGEDSRIRAAFSHWRNPAASQPRVVGNPFLEMAAAIALAHHEKWDGSGYPQGLAGETIPLEARIVAIADAFDALTSRRPYKEPYPEEEALAIVADAAGTHFDLQVYAAFLAALPEIHSIRERFVDAQSASSPNLPQEVLS